MQKRTHLGVATVCILSCLVGGCAATPAAPDAGAAAVAVPRPSFDRVRYDQPERYLALDGSIGDERKIRDVAATLGGADPESRLAAIDGWMRQNLSCDPSLCYYWRDFDDVQRSRAFGGCADYAITFAALARACGIPTVFVKTMDADWVREFRRTGTCTSWRGHVFLEVYVGGRWRLLEPTGMKLYDDYDTAARVLPGGRWAYDKGGDPRALPLSLDWARWKAQTAAHFRDFDLRLLPVADTGRHMGAPQSAAAAPAARGGKGALYVAADSPVWQAVEHVAQAQGFGYIQSFNEEFDNHLAKARGGKLIVTCVGSRAVPPADRFAEVLPIPMAEIQDRLKQASGGTAARTLADGTRVTLIYGRDEQAVLKVVESLDLRE